jgi:hypothetical protein
VAAGAGTTSRFDYLLGGDDGESLFGHGAAE